MKTRIIKCYRELITFKTFEERFSYLQLQGEVAKETFGFERELNQIFYRSPEWKHTRREIIIRDNGCDLGIDDRIIIGRIEIHHINPITIADIESSNDVLFDPENLISVSPNTHKAIHYGTESLLVKTEPVMRKPFDTCPWRDAT